MFTPLAANCSDVMLCLGLWILTTLDSLHLCTNLASLVIDAGTCALRRGTGRPSRRGMERILARSRAMVIWVWIGDAGAGSRAGRCRWLREINKRLWLWFWHVLCSPPACRLVCLRAFLRMSDLDLDLPRESLPRGSAAPKINKSHRHMSDEAILHSARLALLRWPASCMGWPAVCACAAAACCPARASPLLCCAQWFFYGWSVIDCVGACTSVTVRSTAWS
jgi:hypothetical protein